METHTANDKFGNSLYREGIDDFKSATKDIKRTSWLYEYNHSTARNITMTISLSLKPKLSPNL